MILNREVQKVCFDVLISTTLKWILKISVGAEAFVMEISGQWSHVRTV